jgi:hypothetical protein
MPPLLSELIRHKSLSGLDITLSNEEGAHRAPFPIVNTALVWRQSLLTRSRLYRVSLSIWPLKNGGKDAATVCRHQMAPWWHLDGTLMAPFGCR